MSLYRIGLLGLALLTLHVAHAHAESTPLLAYVAAKNANPKRLDVFKKGLAELGYAEGKNIRIEYREAVLDTDYHAVMADLIDRKVDLILAANVAATRAAARATKTSRSSCWRCSTRSASAWSGAWNGPAPMSRARPCTLRS